MLTFSQWKEMLRGLGATTFPLELFNELLEAYSPNARAYHNSAHIADCLQQWEAARYLAQQPALVEAAIWYHDVVYDPQANGNEEMSAAWAEQHLMKCGVEESVITEIAALILMTKHLALPETIDQMLLVDVDLSILGRDSEAFDTYDRGIRAEYSWLPDEVYTRGRKQVLESFLKREVIFSTQFFREKYELSARANLQRVIANLE